MHSTANLCSTGIGVTNRLQVVVTMCLPVMKEIYSLDNVKAAHIGKKVVEFHTVYTGVTFGLGIGVPKE